MKWIRIIICAVICLFGFTAVAQLTPEKLRQFLFDEHQTGKASLRSLSLVKMLYQKNNYQAIWLNTHDGRFASDLMNELGLCDDLGLNASDYQVKFIQVTKSGSQLNTLIDSLLAELKLSDAALHFYSDIAYGNNKPNFGYNGLSYTIGCFDIPLMLLQHVYAGRLPALKNSIAGLLPEIPTIVNELQRLNRVLKEDGFSEANVLSGKISSSNKPLLVKLIQMGLITDTSINYSDSVLKEKVKQAQYRYNIVTDGAAGKNTLKELNVPLSVRKRQLIFSLNYFRWLSCLTQNRNVIVVNIPAAYMKVYRDHSVVLEMRMIVGKKSTPTYTIASMVNEVVLYPYWHVPYSIAVKELLPIIKKNPGFIDAGNYQVLNRNGDIVNPYVVNWQSLGPGYFPYLIRQSTGCDNALGLLKLNFYNPFGAYLHDTNSKYLFRMQRRFFSHGCMRMEKPMELGHLVLKDNHIAIDTLEQKGCLRNQNPVIVKADERMPVIVWYNPVGIDATGKLIYFEDVYEKFKWSE